MGVALQSTEFLIIKAFKADYLLLSP